MRSAAVVTSFKFDSIDVLFLDASKLLALALSCCALSDSAQVSQMT